MRFPRRLLLEFLLRYLNRMAHLTPLGGLPLLPSITTPPARRRSLDRPHQAGPGPRREKRVSNGTDLCEAGRFSPRPQRSQRGQQGPQAVSRRSLQVASSTSGTGHHPVPDNSSARRPETSSGSTGQYFRSGKAMPARKAKNSQKHENKPPNCRFSSRTHLQKPRKAAQRCMRPSGRTGDPHTAAIPRGSHARSPRVGAKAAPALRAGRNPGASRRHSFSRTAGPDMASSQEATQLSYIKTSRLPRRLPLRLCCLAL